LRWGVRCAPHNGLVKVLGIDPGTANTGFGVVGTRDGRLVALDGGVVTTSSDLPLEQRLLTISKRIEALIAEHTPDAVSIEDLYFGKNVGSALAVGHARGVVMLAAARAGISCFSYTPQQIKSAVCGQGRADKEQVTTMVQQLLSLPEPPKPDHAADALAAAICHASHAPLLAASQ
jgi:crossover junction endodeoxyribonuclease RuvC